MGTGGSLDGQGLLLSTAAAAISTSATIEGTAATIRDGSRSETARQTGLLKNRARGTALRRTRRHGTCRNNKSYYSTSTLRSATYSQTSSHQPRHQVTGNRPSNAADSKDPGGSNLAVLRLSRLRHETPTAAMATKNSCPGAKARVGISAGTSRNPAR